jgi:hypothetical protein
MREQPHQPYVVVWKSSDSGQWAIRQARGDDNLALVLQEIEQRDADADWLVLEGEAVPQHDLRLAFRPYITREGA